MSETVTKSFDKTKVNDLKTLWKQIAATKRFDSCDVFVYNVIRALFSKSNSKVEVAQGLLYKAFTPVTNKNKLENGWGEFKALELILEYGSYPYGKNFKTMMNILSEEDQVEFIKLVKQLKKEKWSDPTFAYIFTRQDISKEQQLVQTAHCTLLLGQNTKVNGNNLHFCVFGVENGCEIFKRYLSLELAGVKTVEFYEYNFVMTSFACLPMRKSFAARKKLFKDDILLSF